MEHIMIHLPEECQLGGPVQYRWMYPFERLMRLMKMLVKNKSRVEGSIAERYMQEKLIHLCSLYFEADVETVHNRLRRNKLPDHYRDPNKLVAFTHQSKLLGVREKTNMDGQMQVIVADYVLQNMPELASYRSTFEEEVRSRNPNITATEMDSVLSSQYRQWLFSKVQHKPQEQLFAAVIRGPACFIQVYQRCIINGFRFACNKKYGSGVMVKGSAYGDSIDNYYGRLVEIIKLTYDGGNQLLLFKCHWVDPRRGVKIDKDEVTTVDFSKKYRGSDIYILASQATQVFYAPSVCDPKSPIHTTIPIKNLALDKKVDKPIEENYLQNDITNVTLREPLEYILNVDLTGFRRDTSNDV